MNEHEDRLDDEDVAQSEDDRADAEEAPAEEADGPEEALAQLDSDTVRLSQGDLAPTASEPEAGSAAEALEPEAEPEQAGEPEVEAETVAEPESDDEPEAESEVDDEPEAVADVELAGEPETEEAGEPEVEAETVAVSESDDEPEAESEVDDEPEPEAVADVELAGEPETESEAEVDDEAEAEPESVDDVEPAGELEVEPEAEVDDDAEAEPEPDDEAEPEPDDEAEPELDDAEQVGEPEAEEAGEVEAAVGAEPVIVLPAAIPPASRVRPDPEPEPEPEPAAEAEPEAVDDAEQAGEPEAEVADEPEPEADAETEAESVADAEQAGEVEAAVGAEPVIVLPAAIPPASRVRPDPEPVPEPEPEPEPVPVADTQAQETAGRAQESEQETDEAPGVAPGAPTGLLGAEPEASVSPEAPATVKAATPEKTAKATRAAAATGILHRMRRMPRGRLAAVAAAGLLVLVWGGAAWATTLSTSAGATVSGVDVGGMSAQEAQAAVETAMTASLSQPVTVTVTDSSDQLVPAESGVAVDAAASVKQLTGFTLNPVTIVQRLTGPEVEAVTVVDDKALTAALNDRLPTLSDGTVDATVTLDGTTPVVTQATAGTGLDVEASVSALTQDWPLGESSIALQEGVAVPAITDEDASTFVEGTLTPLLSGDLTITATGTSVESKAATKDLVLTPEQVAAVLTISAEGGDLSAVLDSEALHAAVVGAMGEIEVPAQDATWTIDGTAAGAATATPQYVAPSSGEGVDMAALTASLIEAGRTGTTTSQRTVPLPITVLEPTNTTPQDQWGITEVVGEYSTPFTSEYARDQNLTRGAELMNGQVVMPGETFSVNDALGEVDAEHGFVAAGVISNGEHVDAMGGGLSQIGTTMFNAGFEAGMDDVEHHPHSYWFERYPAGREATIWTGEKDVKFANSTPYPVLIQAWVADGRVHARIWSTHYYDVTITSGEPYNYRPVQTVTRTAGPNCTPYGGGSAGFDIVVTRTRTAPDKTVPDDVLETSYSADNVVLCVSTASAPSDTSTSSGTAAAPEPATQEQTTTTQEQTTTSQVPEAAASDQSGSSPAEPAPSEPAAPTLETITGARAEAAASADN
ncbi:VanW family protein [Actinomyces howellii]|uniref:Uncharacterized vancomycin resistance protein n=1 Tax=Actinomyces howellii TaxID=52771 RepID=A0A3S4RGY0_9ACTO|nr:VanW family protein [Actinomyces howellii]VEG29798.1 Uncharacterized vancomycin resistance protein [Actinomyces howellii]